MPSRPAPPAASSVPQTVEFSLEGGTALQHKGFTIEPSRGSVERGQTKTISISWMPPADFDVGATDSGQEGLQRPKARRDGAPAPPREGAAGWAPGR